MLRNEMRHSKTWPWSYHIITDFWHPLKHFHVFQKLFRFFYRCWQTILSIQCLSGLCQVLTLLMLDTPPSAISERAFNTAASIDSNRVFFVYHYKDISFYSLMREFHKHNSCADQSYVMLWEVGRENIVMYMRMKRQFLQLSWNLCGS